MPAVQPADAEAAPRGVFVGPSDLAQKRRQQGFGALAGQCRVIGGRVHPVAGEHDEPAPALDVTAQPIRPQVGQPGHVGEDDAAVVVQPMLEEIRCRDRLCPDRGYGLAAGRRRREGEFQEERFVQVRHRRGIAVHQQHGQAFQHIHGEVAGVVRPQFVGAEPELAGELPAPAEDVAEDHRRLCARGQRHLALCDLLAVEEEAQALLDVAAARVQQPAVDLGSGAGHLNVHAELDARDRQVLLHLAAHVHQEDGHIRGEGVAQLRERGGPAQPLKIRDDVELLARERAAFERGQRPPQRPGQLRRAVAALAGLEFFAHVGEPRRQFGRGLILRIERHQDRRIALSEAVQDVRHGLPGPAEPHRAPGAGAQGIRVVQHHGDRRRNVAALEGCGADHRAVERPDQRGQQQEPEGEQQQFLQPLAARHPLVHHAQEAQRAERHALGLPAVHQVDDYGDGERRPEQMDHLSFVPRPAHPPPLPARAPTAALTPAPGWARHACPEPSRGAVPLLLLLPFA